MWNAFPVIGHLISLLINISLAIPFWICWTLFGVGTKYFYFLPEPFHVISFWSCVGLFIVFGILQGVLPWPKLVAVSQTNSR